MWTKIRDLVGSINKKSDSFDEKYVKMKFNSDGEVHLNKAMEINNETVVVRAVFHENNKYYPQVF